MNNNLENKIKQQIEERRIEPSDHIWQQLENKVFTHHFSFMPVLPSEQ
jgi:hypothetical protein